MTDKQDDNLVQSGVGITQSIRTRLRFTDDYKWKRFSARRLELIDELDLSSRKASEQDEKINLVANRLREEYGFPEEALSDFHKLVRAGIQSVRRNRKRSYLKGTGGSSFGSASGGGMGNLNYSTNSSSNESPVLGSGSSPTGHGGSSTTPGLVAGFTPVLTSVSGSNSSSGSIPTKFPVPPTATATATSNTSVLGLGLNSITHESSELPPIQSIPSTPHRSSHLPDGFRKITNQLQQPQQLQPSLDRLKSPYNDTDDEDDINPLKRPRPIRPSSQNNERISITSLISPSPPNQATTTTLPPMSSLSLSSSNVRDDLFILALERLQQLTNKLSTLLPSNSNTEFLGQSIMSTAAAYAVERRLPNHEISETVRSYVLSYSITSALVKALSLHSFSSLKIAIASCCREYGFDTIIHSLSTLYYEMFNIDPQFDLTNQSSYDKMASVLASATTTNRISITSHKTGLISAPSSTITTLSTSSNSSNNIRPVTLRFRDQKLEFTYSPARASSPPTIAEVLDNGRNAFSINKEQPIQIENRNRPGKILITDADVADTFTEARIDIELQLLTKPKHLPQPIPTSISTRPKFQELL